MKHTKKEDGGILAIISWTVTLILLLVWIFLTWNLYSWKVTRIEEENNRQWDYYRDIIKTIENSTGSISDEIATLRAETLWVRNTLDNIETVKAAKIYDLEITICKMVHYTDILVDVEKRKVHMKDVVGINPSVERTATVVDTGLWYGSSVEIPTIMDDEEEYACGLSIISVR